MFDAAGGATGVQLAEQAAAESVTSDSLDQGENLAQAVSSGDEPPARNEIVVIDSAIDDYQSLLDGMDPSLEVIVLEPGADMNDLAQALSGYSQVDGIHLFTHGSTGSLNFSGGALTADNLAANQDALLTIGNALSADGDVLLYGCSVGADGEGQDFIDALAEATGADIAASDDATGAAILGGDWDLEVQSGSIESDAALDAEAAAAFHGLLLTDTIENAWTGTQSNFVASEIQIGQSFTATQTGTLSRIGVLFASNPNQDLTVDIYAGEAVSGSSLGQFTWLNANTAAAGSTSDWNYLDVSSGNISVTKDSQYTFVFAQNDDATVYFRTDTGTGYTGGQLYYNQSGSGAFQAGYDMFFQADITYTANAAPTVSGAPTDVTVTEDTESNVDLSAMSFADTDGDTLTVTLTASAGTFSTPADGAGVGGGVTENKVSATQITLQGAAADINTYLDTITNIKYTAASNVSGNDQATITVSASDGTTTLASNPSINIDVTAVNDAPTLASVPTDVTVTEDTASNVDLSAVTFADVDTTTADVTFTITAGAGTLAASSGGSVTVSNSGTSAITLTGTASNIDTYLNTASNIQYTGAFNANGNDVTTLTLTANDQDGSGNVSLGTVNVDITAVNDAPVLDNSKSPAMTTITEDLAAPTNGSTTNSIQVAGLIDNGGSLSNYTDVEGDSIGIAITAVNANGTLYYSTDGGTNWAAVGAVSANSARVLFADANTRVYFKPDANDNGSLSDAFTFKAWDRTGGHSNGDATVDTTSGTAFSSATDTVSITVSAVNDDPTVSSMPTDITVTEDTASNVDLSALTFADVDSGSNAISLVLTAGAGTLTASSSGGVTISNSGTSAITLSGTASDIDTYLNTASNIQYTSASNASGNNVTTLNLTSNDGGATGTGGGNNVNHGNINIDITNVNDAPTTSGTYSFTSFDENTTATGVTVATLVAGLTTSDVEGDTLGIAVTGTTGNGTWQFSHDSSNGSDGTWTSFASGNTPAAATSLLLAHTAYVRYVPDSQNSETATITVRGWDQTSGTASSGTTARYADTSTNGNATPYSSGTATGSQAVTAVNDVPVVDLDASAGGVTYSTSFSAGGSAAAIANTDATYADVDTSDTQASLTATLTSRPDGDSVESLSLNSTASTAATNAGLTVTYTSATGVLSISGAASTSVYQTILRGIVYNNTDAAADITTGNRTINVVGNDGDGNSSTAAATVSVVTAPVTDLNGATAGTTVTVSFTEGDGATVIAGSATVTEPDGDNLNQFVVTLTNAQTGDILKVGARSNGDVVNGITITETSASVITLSGSATAANYQALVREITFNNTSEAPSTTARTITFAGRDVNSNTGASATATVNVSGVNDSPSFSGLNGTPSTNENTAVVLDADATIDDAELNAADNYNGATLTLARNGGANASDTFAHKTGGTLSTMTQGGNLTVGGTTIGTVMTNSGGTLLLTFNANATSALVDSAFQQITYANASDTEAGNVQIDYTFSDGTTVNQGSGGAKTATGSVTVTVTAVNDEPTLSATGSSPTFSVGGAAVGLFSGSTFSTVESGQNISSMVMTVTNLSDGAGEKLVIDGTEVALTNGTSGNTGTNTFGYSVSVAGTTATVTITKTATAATYKTMADTLAYKNTAVTPTQNADRVATITTVNDDGGTTNGGDNSAPVAIASTITVGPAPASNDTNNNQNISQQPGSQPAPSGDGGGDPVNGLTGTGDGATGDTRVGSDNTTPGVDTGGVNPGDPNADAGFTFGGDPTSSQGVDTLGIIGVAVSGNSGALNSFYGAGNAASSNGTGADAANGGSSGTSSARGSMSALLGGSGGGLGSVGGGGFGGGAGGGAATGGGATGGGFGGGADAGAAGSGGQLGGPGGDAGTGNGANVDGANGEGQGQPQPGQQGQQGQGAQPPAQGGNAGQQGGGQGAAQGQGQGQGGGQGQGQGGQGQPGDGQPPAGDGGQPQQGGPGQGDQGGPQEGAFFQPDGRTSFTDQLAAAAQTQQSSLDKLVEAMERLAS